ncbi:hypothetical protein [Sphingomonas sp. PR090111-T3T-6A]|uniref:hypothetical protein n=1 Tax=Sphingomonas sp. PR090111-T3T-6A TaxID=685778 RepID=UPI000371CBB4|nr:hypothetical protein [Sphingomonas sp. PR090111-T3T-6A]
MARDPGRPLTPGERALADAMFGDAIDGSAVRLHRACWWPFQPNGVVMAPDGDIWFHPADPVWCEDFADAALSAQGLLIHELTHVWQAQRGGRWFLPLARHPFCHYRYELVPGRSFGRYGIEQQAEIVRHAFLMRQGACIAGKPDLEAYEALLPFA